MTIGIAFSSFIICTTSIIFFQNLFFRRKIIDKINKRSSHKVLATRSGGVSIFIPIFLLSVFYYVQGLELFDYGIILPLMILLIVGLYDDIYNVDFKLKFLFQIIVAKIIIDNGLIIDNMHGMFGINELNRIIAQLITIFIIVAVINAINFIDGIDGLALSIITLFIIGYEFFVINTSEFYFLSVILIFSFIPLLIFNFKEKNKVFLGDSGSLLLGTVVSIYVLNILSQDYIIKVQYDLNKIIFVISLLSYPIFDIIRIFIFRLYKRKSPFVADKNHIHHILLEKFRIHWKVTILLSIFSILILVSIQLLNGLIY
mgnify:FL=1